MSACLHMPWLDPTHPMPYNMLTFGTFNIRRVPTHTHIYTDAAVSMVFPSMIPMRAYTGRCSSTLGTLQGAWCLCIWGGWPGPRPVRIERRTNSACTPYLPYLAYPLSAPGPMGHIQRLHPPIRSTNLSAVEFPLLPAEHMPAL